jgi:hypothetical protein
VAVKGLRFGLVVGDAQAARQLDRSALLGRHQGWTTGRERLIVSASVAVG